MSTQKKRSDSSKALRSQLARDYVVVPDVSPRIDIGRYVAVARIAQEEAKKSGLRQEHSRAYVDYRKFLDLALKIASHPSYRERSDVQAWFKAETGASMIELEAIVGHMDAAQDKILESFIDLQLMAEFDNEDFSNGVLLRPKPPTPATVAPIPTPTLAVSQDDPFSVFTSAPSQLPPAPTAQPPVDDAEMRQRRQDRIRAAFFVPSREGEKLESATNACPATTTAVVPPDVPAAYTFETSTTSSAPKSPIDDRELRNHLSTFAATLSSEDIALLNLIISSSNSSIDSRKRLQMFKVPSPTTSETDFLLGETTVAPQVSVLNTLGMAVYCTGSTNFSSRFVCRQDDFQASFVPVLTPSLQSTAEDVRDRLSVSRSVCETNRCFFLHLGIATGLHPFLLQFYFRAMSSILQSSSDSSPWYGDIVQSVRDYAGFVDAQVLAFIWPRELIDFRLCFLSGNREAPVISVFDSPTSAAPSSAASAKTEVLIHCNGSHFTLLRPRSPHSEAPSRASQGFAVIDTLCAEAKRLGKQVQQYRALDLLVEERKGSSTDSESALRTQLITKHIHSVWDIAQSVLLLCSQGSR